MPVHQYRIYNPATGWTIDDYIRTTLYWCPWATHVDAISHYSDTGVSTPCDPVEEQELRTVLQQRLNFLRAGRSDAQLKKL